MTQRTNPVIPEVESVFEVLDEHEGRVYCASELAIVAATVAYRNEAGEYADPKGLAAAMIAAHSKTLGLDRSVCLRDIVEAPERAPLVGKSKDNFADRLDLLEALPDDE